MPEKKSFKKPIHKEGGGVVEFDNIDSIKKKSVTGLLRKRAKKYDSDSDNEKKDTKAPGEDIRDPF